MKLLLVGNFGVGNLGDEALRQYFVTRFSDVDWTIVSANPSGTREVPRLPLGFRSFRQPWGKTLQAYRQAEGVVFGGGSLLTDTESTLACILWWLHAVVARIYGKPVFLAFQGIGPFRSAFGEWFARSTARMAQFVSVRDEFSLKRVQQWGIADVVLTFDPVLKIIEPHLATSDQSKLTIALIPRSNSKGEFIERMKEVLQGKHPDEVRIISLQHDHPRECKLCDELPEQLGMPCTCRAVHTLQELADALTGVSYVLTERYHGGIAAIGLGIPFGMVVQSPEDKLSALKMYESGSHRLDSLALVQWGEEELREALRILEKTPD